MDRRDLEILEALSKYGLDEIRDILESTGQDMPLVDNKIIESIGFNKSMIRRRINKMRDSGELLSTINVAFRNIGLEHVLLFSDCRAVDSLVTQDFRSAAKCIGDINGWCSTYLVSMRNLNTFICYLEYLHDEKLITKKKIFLLSNIYQMPIYEDILHSKEQLTRDYEEDSKIFKTEEKSTKDITLDEISIYMLSELERDPFTKVETLSGKWDKSHKLKKGTSLPDFKKAWDNRNSFQDGYFIASTRIRNQRIDFMEYFYLVIYVSRLANISRIMNNISPIHGFGFWSYLSYDNVLIVKLQTYQEEFFTVVERLSCISRDVGIESIETYLLSKKYSSRVGIPYNLYGKDGWRDITLDEYINMK